MKNNLMQMRCKKKWFQRVISPRENRKYPTLTFVYLVSKRAKMLSLARGKQEVMTHPKENCQKLALTRKMRSVKNNLMQMHNKKKWFRRITYLRESLKHPALAFV